MNYGFVIDNRKCIGCHACTVACKSEHDIPIGVNRTHVKYVEKGTFPATRRTFTVIRCNHCEKAPCTTICPTAALFTRRDGIVDFDSERCIACRSCMQACPYDALYIDPQTRTAAKCNYCAHRIEGGFEPACAIVCPVEAIVSGDLDNPNSRISRLVGREEITIRKPEKGTLPNVFYIDGDQAALNPLANSPLSSYATTRQSSGVGHYARTAEDRLDRATEEELVFPVDASNSDLENWRDSLEGLLSERGFAASQALDDVTRESGAVRSQRVYDTPGKGILWRWQVPAYIWTKAIAAGTFMVVALSPYFSGQLTTREEVASLWISFLFLGFTAVLLVQDLDRPDRFLYVLFRPNWTSWLVRGAYIISAFGLVIVLMLAAAWSGWTDLADLLRIPGLVLAVMSAVYTAFLFAQARGRALWQSSLSPIRMTNHAVLGGSAVLLLLKPASFAGLAGMLTVSLGLNLAMLLTELFLPHSSEEGARAAKFMRRGRLGLFLWFGLASGTLVPMLLCLTSSAPQVGVLVALGILAGIYLTESAWVRAPQLVPLA